MDFEELTEVLSYPWLSQDNMSSKRVPETIVSIGDQNDQYYFVKLPHKVNQLVTHQ